MLLPSFVCSIEITALLPSIVDKDVVAFTYVCGLLMCVWRGVGTVCAFFPLHQFIFCSLLAFHWMENRMEFITN